MGDGAGAHGAGLERHIEVAAVEPAGAADFESGTDGEEFGMGGGVAHGLHAVAFGGKDAFTLDDHGTDRRFADGGGFGGEREGEVHGCGHGRHAVPLSPREREGKPKTPKGRPHHRPTSRRALEGSKLVQIASGWPGLRRLRKRGRREASAAKRRRGAGGAAVMPLTCWL